MHLEHQQNNKNINRSSSRTIERYKGKELEEEDVQHRTNGLAYALIYSTIINDSEEI